MCFPPFIQLLYSKSKQKSKTEIFIPKLNSVAIPLAFSLSEVQLPPAWRIQGWAGGPSQGSKSAIEFWICCVTLDVNLTFLDLSFLCKLDINNFNNYFIVNQLIEPSWGLIKIICLKNRIQFQGLSKNLSLSWSLSWVLGSLFVSCSVVTLELAILLSKLQQEKFREDSRLLRKMVALSSPEITGHVSSEEGLQFCLPWRKRRVLVPYDLWVSRIGPAPYHVTASCLQVSRTPGALSSQQSSFSSQTSPIPSIPSWRASSVSRASPLPQTLFSPLHSPWTGTDFSYTLVEGTWRPGRPPHPHDSMGPGFKSLCCRWVVGWARHAPSHLWASDSSLVKWGQGTLICSSRITLETPWVIERESAPWTHRLL